MRARNATLPTRMADATNGHERKAALHEQVAPRTDARAPLTHAALVLLGYALLYLLFFAPVLFSDRLLAPGDGIIYFLPNFAAPHVFWDASIWGGFPAVGDAQLMTWYPPALLFSLCGAGGYQPFLLTAYVLASSFTYGYVFTLTRSRFAATLSGCVYGLCAFMIAHLGHAAVVHTAAWLPLVIWSLTELQSREISRRWFVSATLAIACAALAGHPQIFVYTLCLGTAFALVTGWHAPVGRWRYYGLCALVVALGAGLAALQLWPTAELAGLSWRAALGFAEFVAYELPLRQAPVLLFPFLYGGAPGAFYGVHYFGAWPSSADGWGAGELSGYVGLLPLMLAALGFIAHRRNVRACFWIGVCAVAFLLTLGEATPLARLVYYLPVANKFRVPARHFLELTFAVSILAGLGGKAIQQQTISRRLLRRILVGAGSALCVCLLTLFLFAAKLNELAVQRLGHTVTLKPWANPAVGVPLLLFLSGGAALLYWHAQPRSRPRSALLIVALLVDLASFGWFYEWHYSAPYKAYRHAPAPTETYRAALAATHQRLLPVRGGTGRVAELPPNLSKLWDVPSASGYGPFILTRVSRLLTMPPHGSLDASWREPANQSLDLMAVRYLLVPPDEIEPPALTDERGTHWAASDFAAQLGPGCDPHYPTAFKLDLPTPLRATQIGVVSALACSAQLADAQTFATLTLTDVAARTVSLTLSAGHESSEWAYDCADVRPTMQQGRAPVFRSYPVERGGARCAGHDYVALLSIQASAQNEHIALREIKSIELHWTGPPGTFALKKITLLDEQAHTSTPINPVAGSLNDVARWRPVGDINAANSGYGAEVQAADVGAARVFENLRARPRAWLVPAVLRVSADEAVNAIRTSRLPDGRNFEPARLALVAAPLDFKTEQADPNATAQIMRVRADEMDVRVNTNAPAFLVTSDVFYPGWRATIDGAPARLYQTDYTLRGVQVPAGAHVVRFEFMPKSFYYGLGLSALSLLLLVGCTFWLKRGGLPAGCAPHVDGETAQQ